MLPFFEIELESLMTGEGDEARCLLSLEGKRISNTEPKEVLFHMQEAGSDEPLINAINEAIEKGAVKIVPECKVLELCNSSKYLKPKEVEE